MRIARGILPLSLLLALASPAPPAWAQRAGDLRQQARQLVAAGRDREALPLLDEALRKKPRDIESRVLRGNIHLRLNRPDAALADFDAALHANPLYSPPYTDRGIALTMLGRDDEAYDQFRRALMIHNLTLFGRRDPALSSVYSGIAQLEHRRGADDAALANYELAIRHNPADPSPHAGMGDVLLARGQFAEAIARYDAALRINPGLSRAYAGRGDAFGLLGREKLALADLDAALRIDPDYVRAHRLRGSLLAHLGRDEEALVDLDAAVRLDPNSAGAHKDRGGLLVRMGRTGAAIADLDEAIRLDPSRAASYQNRGAAYNLLGQYERAITDFDQAILLDPKNAGAHSNRGLSYFALGRAERAIEDMTEAIRLDPRSAIARLNRGGVYAKVGLADEAVRDFEAALALDPRAVGAYTASGHGAPGSLAGGSPPRAQDLAAWLAPAAPSTYCARGNSHRTRGDWTSAIGDYSRALQSDPRCAEALVARGWARLCAGRDGADADARAYLEQVRHRDPLAPYMALLGYFASCRAGRISEARVFLDEAAANTPSTDWPMPLIRYVRREIDLDTLLQSARTDRQITEAHAFGGLGLLDSGDPKQAAEHLRIAGSRDDDRSIAADLARATLRRLEEAPPQMADLPPLPPGMLAPRRFAPGPPAGGPGPVVPPILGNDHQFTGIAP